jgi:hypothetical protein
MVSQGMGLLDDAIREHLELKRRRGADPGEIALQERDALDPVYRAQDAAVDGPEGFHESAAIDPAAEAENWATGPPVEPAPGDLERREDAAAGGPEDFAGAPGHGAGGQDDARPHGDPLAGSHASVAAQETAELDMEAVLAAEDEHEGPQGDQLGAEALGAEAEHTDWDFPGGHREEPAPEPIPGQERLSFE